ncbi:hypothetical protein [Amycolatopsis palatopharyngis]|nr:hypothetical protein [Amycolatopsis palatopharyngis]
MSYNNLKAAPYRALYTWIRRGVELNQVLRVMGVRIVVTDARPRATD